MEQKGPKKSTNNPNTYWHKYKKSYKEDNQLLSKQESIGWNNLLHGKFSKSGAHINTIMKPAIKIPIVWLQLVQIQNYHWPETENKKKWKTNVFQQIILSLFGAASSM